MLAVCCLYVAVGLWLWWIVVVWVGCLVGMGVGNSVGLMIYLFDVAYDFTVVIAIYVLVVDATGLFSLLYCVIVELHWRFCLGYICGVGAWFGLVVLSFFYCGFVSATLWF